MLTSSRVLIIQVCVCGHGTQDGFDQLCFFSDDILLANSMKCPALFTDALQLKMLFNVECLKSSSYHLAHSHLSNIIQHMCLESKQLSFE